MTHEELKVFKETEFDCDEKMLGSWVICDPNWYTELPPNCKEDTVPTSIKNNDYRTDGVCDCFVSEEGEFFISESEMEAGICIEWPIIGRNQMNTKDKIIMLSETPSNNHGCRGFGVNIRITGDRTGIVSDEYSCGHNCHGGEHHWYEIGQEVILPDEFASWEEAQEYTENNGSFSDAGRTKLAPGEF